jgi:hypothetical protein
MASAISAKEFDDWLTPIEALHVLSSKHGTDSHSYKSKHTLLERLRADEVRAVAGRSKRNTHSQGERTKIDPDEWHHVAESDIFWTTGDLTYRTKGQYESNWTNIRHFDVRFNPHDVQSIIGKIPTQAPPPESHKQPVDPLVTRLAPLLPAAPLQNKGGAPRKEWWDDLWVAICLKIYRAELIPTKQKHIEDAMMDWVEKHGDEKVGVQTVRPAARKLWNAWLAEKDKN